MKLKMADTTRGIYQMYYMPVYKIIDSVNGYSCAMRLIRNEIGLRLFPIRARIENGIII
jgi:hypothetical protein